ncbi:hypothetical protein ABH935_001182 [Catenulispora sp. GAS73]|uniref:hypothetical protein n=1 Tax=Catenulispora sp. GAS73 TaxID=3156269 RepID=UPI0035114218
MTDTTNVSPLADDPDVCNVTRIGSGDDDAALDANRPTYAGAFAACCEGGALGPPVPTALGPPPPEGAEPDGRPALLALDGPPGCPALVGPPPALL